MPNHNWSMKIELAGRSFHHLQQLVAHANKCVQDARNYRQACIVTGGDYGDLAIRIASPIEERIKDLRAEADALEKEAGKGETDAV